MRLALVTLLGTALLSGGCDGDRSVRISSGGDGETRDSGVLKVVDGLQCPQTQGDLTLRGARQEGAVCTYAGPRGAEVTLHLVRLDGATPEAALGRFENELARDVPRAAGDPEPPAPPRRPSPPGQSQDRVDVDLPGVDVQAEGDSADVRLPGIRIEADGERANVSIAGFQIRADDTDASVDIAGGGDGDSVYVRADETGAEVPTREAGEAIRSTYILSGNDETAEGWRTVGYVARGPGGGPMIVAVFRTRETDQDGLFDDAEDLVSLNVGD